MSEPTIYCKLLKIKISDGQCLEISGVAEKMLKKSSCPELSVFTDEEIKIACDSCKYSN